MSKKGGAKKAVEEVKEVAKPKLVPLADGVPNIMDDLGKKQIFKKFSYRGKDIMGLLSLNMEETAYI